jgi:uncharacterized membrane protein YkoI
MKFARIALAALLFAGTVHAQSDEASEKTEAAKSIPALAAALKEATVSLAAALSASEAKGTPVSAKFELEDGQLQLSVYTMKAGKFYEVIVDHKTGKIAKTEPITGGEDLTAAQHQAEAIAKSKHSLREAVAQAEQANAGYKAISVEAEIEDGEAQADVLLLKGTQSRYVEQKL